MGRTHPNLVGHWRMENNLTDTSGNGNNGTVGAGSAAYVDGKIGRAWDNDGTRYGVLPMDGKDWIEDGFSVGMWVRTTSTASQNIFGAANDGTTTALGVILNFTTSNRLFVSVRSESGETVNPGTGVSVNNAFAVDTWFHFCFVADPVANLGKVYINGVFAGESQSTLNVDNFAPFDYPIFFGRRNNRGTPTGSPLLGQLDDVQIWNRALAPNQIRAIYNGVDPAFIGDVA